MVNSFDKLSSIIETEIMDKNNFISKNSLFITSFSEILSIFKDGNILELTNEHVDIIKKVLIGNLQLTSEEFTFLNYFTKIPENMKDRFKQLNLKFNPEQEKTIKQIKNKLQLLENFYGNIEINNIQSELTRLKTLLSKLQENDINLIQEIDYIYQLLEKHQVSIEEQIQIFSDINELNLRIYDNLALPSYTVDDEERSFDDLNITNLDVDILIDLFKEFGLNWDDLKPINQEQLQLYGVEQNIRDIFTLLKKENFFSVLKNQDILTRTLLFSNATLIQDLIHTLTKHNLRYLVSIHPTLLYPTMKENNVFVFSRRTKRNGDPKTHTTGYLTHFLGNVHFLEELGISVSDVANSHIDFFTKSPKTIKKNFESFKLYGIDGKKTFSWVGSTNVLDKLDIAIESGCLEYYQENLTKLLNPLNLYRVKLCCKQKNISDPMRDEYETIFSTRHNRKDGTTFRCFRQKFHASDEYGKNEEETFRI